MLSRIATTVLFTLGLAVPGARADDASRLAIAREIVVVTHTVDNMRALAPTLTAQIRAVMLKRGDVDPKMLDQILGRMSQHFDQELGAFVDLAAKVYAREFSEEDLQAVLAFDRTPAGQHLIDKQPIIMGAMVTAGQKWGESVGKQVAEEIAKEKRAAPPPKL